ncbi:hypothetical protein LMG19083_04924 [Ralstonia psammae]|uniref:Type IV secretion system protein n=1 Tax=Ralstonia psammae TaxID=3058598 RepID=A0ABM9JZJ9_9RALS|nr:type IV secretion system protein [Ralstonia sp. LMG 19083]CAJ0809401.1 hypothetical protein LMG19083_04924 [Ralstonia sp. LMG 19083]
MTTFFTTIGGQLTGQFSPAALMADNLATTLSDAIVPVYTSATAVMLLFHGLAIVRGETQQPFAALLGKIIKLMLIIGVIQLYGHGGTWANPTTGQSASTDVIQLVLQLQGEFVSAVTQALNAAFGTPLTDNAFTVIDNSFGMVMSFFAGLMLLGITMFSDGSAGNITTGLLIFFFIVMGGGVVALAFFYAMLSQFGLLLVLGFGPIFIAGLAFGPTARYFDGWLSSILGFTLLGAVSSAVLTVVSQAQGITFNQSMNLFVSMVLMGVTGFVFLLFMLEVPRLVSQLTQGADVTGGFVGMAQVKGLYSAPWFGGRGSAVNPSIAGQIMQRGK